ncbi:MAG: ABC transporter ATP-binding protein [Firmicutes bacterium]|nr:ABC transporter ATP-binding protein [Bacillota bacterium]
MQPLLEVDDLHVHFRTYGGTVQAVRGVSLRVHAGETLALVGESGCGKSVSMQAVMGLLPPTARIVAGSIRLEGQELVGMPEDELNRLRGVKMAMIFQDPMTSLNPVLTIGRQIMEVMRVHMGVGAAEARRRALEMLELVGIPSPERRLRQYPHEFSGGMRQRIMIAMALACRPQLLIADEPTTALDVTIQAQILELIRELQKTLGMAVILITHSMGVVAGMADRVAVMYAGQVVEEGCLADVFKHASHPYSWGLLKAVPHLDMDRRQTLRTIPGQPPDLTAPPAGCAFHPRCPYAMNVCLEAAPPVLPAGPGHAARCWLAHPEAAEQMEAARRREQAAGA